MYSLLTKLQVHLIANNEKLFLFYQTTVIDGKTGKRLIDPPLRDTIGSQSSPLTVAMEGLGNDAFIVWMADCAGHEGATEEFSFVKGRVSYFLFSLYSLIL